nr:MerR family DNA-binding transcriptional regulator [Microvirga arabica]
MDQYAVSADAGNSGEGAKFYTIGDLAREFGVTLRTLRFYEDRGLLSPAGTAPPAFTTPATVSASP